MKILDCNNDVILEIEITGLDGEFKRDILAYIRKSANDNGFIIQ